ncbi:LssY C-terminal domain-containing protein, partial [Rhizobium ruizarguesonis]
MGNLQQLRQAFATAGWSTADHLGIESSLRMIRAF